MLFCIWRFTGDDSSNHVSKKRDNKYTRNKVNLAFATPKCVPGNALFYFGCHAYDLRPMVSTTNAANAIQYGLLLILTIDARQQKPLLNPQLKHTEVKQTKAWNQTL